MYGELIAIVWVLISGLSGLYVHNKIREHSHRVDLLHQDQKIAREKIAMLAFFEDSPPTKKQHDILMQLYREELQEAQDRELKTKIFRKNELNFKEKK